MDYHFNLRQGSQKKIRMSPVLCGAGFDRSFSTKSNIDIGACSNDMAAVKPVLDLFTDLHTSKPPSQKTNLFKESSIPPMTSFSSSSMSVSYVVGGFVSSRNQPVSNSSPDICNFFDVLVSSLQNRDTVKMKMPTAKKEPFPDTLHNFDLPLEFIKSSVDNSEQTMNFKRTYADVTKGVLPKPSVSQENEMIPLKISNMNCEVNICSNSSMVAMYTANCRIRKSKLLNMNNYSEHTNMFKISSGTCSSKSLVNGNKSVSSHKNAVPENPSCLHEELLSPIEEFIPCTPIAQHTLLTLPITSSMEIPKVNRTLSECSVDSDDSFVVFQNEDDIGCESVSEDCPSDDLDEVDHLKFLTCSVSPPKSPIEKILKRVSFKPDEKLVEVHNMVTWDFAHRAARIGPWEIYARDRVRFENRISQISMVLSPILETSHREAVFRERFLEKN